MTSRRVIPWFSCVVLLAVGCTESDEKSKTTDKPSNTASTPSTSAEPAGVGAAASGAAASAKYPTGEQPQFSATFTSKGEATRDVVLTGKIYVGAKALRLDIENHPNASGPASFIREHGEDDLWDIDAADKRFDRALSGDWEHDILIHVLDRDVGEDVAKGECPFGYAKPEACSKQGDETVSGVAVEKWQYRKRTIWVAPELRASIKEEYTPYRNNPKTQVVELSNIQPGEQDPALFKIPADYECDSGSFCDSAPR